MSRYNPSGAKSGKVGVIGKRVAGGGGVEEVAKDVYNIHKNENHKQVKIKHNILKRNSFFV